MAGFRQRDKHYFPLKCIEDVVDLFFGQLESDDEPDLTLLSIVIGAVEACLTINRSVERLANGDRNCAATFPTIQLDTIEALYQRFAVYVKGSVDLTQYDGKFSSRELVKKVSDVIWNALARSYHKDKAHLQSIYSFLTGNKLDCYGVALATVAACQQLNCNDVHLALSEDHVWVVFGENASETAEVTWHGKGLEDKRGLPITPWVEEKSWLYLNNHAVICDRYMEVASLVSGINPAINTTMDSVEMSSLQHKLLWILYEKGHLEKYPLALGNLGELEDVSPSGHGVTALELFTQSVDSARKYYNNTHVNPYTYLGSYHYRKNNFRDALYNWAQAGTAISQYNHNREDEEIYKEFLEIANELIPNIMKVASEELHRAHLIPPASTPILQDPECYSLLLQFYDGICQWEEDSSTPVLHVGWAKHFVHSLSKFEEAARQKISVERGEDDVENSSDDDGDDGGEVQPKWQLRQESLVERHRRDSMGEKNSIAEKHAKRNGMNNLEPPSKRGRGRPPKRISVSQNNGSAMDGDLVPSPTQCGVNGNGYGDMPSPAVVSTDAALPDTEGSRVDVCGNNEDHIKSTIEELVSRVGTEVRSDPPNPNLAALAQACSESILNPEFLINGGEPFAMTPSEEDALFKDATSADSTTDGDLLVNKLPLGGAEQFMDTGSGNVSCKASPTLSSEDAQIVPSHPDHKANSHLPDSPTDQLSSPASASSTPGHPDHMDLSSVPLSLHSAKMRGLRHILRAKKLNGNAIKLQMTAQSQVHLKNSETGNITRKRLRRE